MKKNRTNRTLEEEEEEEEQNCFRCVFQKKLLSLCFPEKKKCQKWGGGDSVFFFLTFQARILVSLSIVEASAKGARTG